MKFFLTEPVELVIGDKSMLKNLLDEERPTVTFGDNSQGYTRGYGVISNNSISFERVSYVEGPKYNLLSISQLCNKGFTTRFERSTCKIHDQHSSVALETEREGNAYIIDLL